MIADLLTRKFSAWGASPRNSLCPDSQGRSENAVEACNAGSRRSASLPLDPAPHAKGRDPLLCVVGTRSRAIRAHTPTAHRTPNAERLIS